MNLTEPKTFTFRPIYIILIILLIMLVSTNLIQRNYYKKHLEQIVELNEQEINERIKQHKLDSIKYESIMSRVGELDSLFMIMNDSVKYYKGRAYVNYKKYINEKNAVYTNADDIERNKLFTDILNK